MTVKELIESLSALDPDLKIVLQTDPEGNGYYPLSGVEETRLNDDGAAMHPDDWEYNMVRAVVIYP